MTIVRKNWSLEEIGKWYHEDVERAKAKVQFSGNGGVTWLTFQPSRHSNDDITRIYTLTQHGNLVREIKQEKVKVTNEQAQVLNPTSTFMNAVAKAQAHPAPGSRHSEDIVNVFRTENGGYWFSSVDLKVFRLNEPSAEKVCQVNRTTYYDSVTPNANMINHVELHQGQTQATLRQLGYVFRLTEAANDNGIKHWWPVLQAANPQLKPEDCLVVRCARHFDDSLDDTFRNLGNLVSVAGGKWIWGWSKRFKFGDTWIMPLESKTTLINRIAAAGMAIEPVTTHVDNSVTLADNSTAEVTPEYIMGIRENFEELLAIGDKEKIIDALFQVMEYRNKCVDELKELNKVIEKARSIVSG